MSLKMLQLRRDGCRDFTGLYSYILGFPKAFADAWAVVSLGHNGIGWCPCGARMEQAPGSLRIRRRHVLAITLALVGTEAVRECDNGDACQGRAVGRG